MNLKINNEYDKLLKVVLAPVANEYLDQQKELINILKKYKIEVLMTKYCKEAKYQMFTRDPFVVIGDKILINYMKEPIRQLEHNTFEEILEKIDDNKKIFLKENITLEGGDIIIHNNIIFIGYNGNRTNQEGIEYLNNLFKKEYTIIPLEMNNPNPFIPFVHLDCIFNPISLDTAIVYEKGLSVDSLKIIKDYFSNIIYVTTKEQDELATNVINIGNKTVIVQKRHTRIIEQLTNLGFKVELTKRYETVKETGYTRCLTCPLERE